MRTRIIVATVLLLITSWTPPGQVPARAAAPPQSVSVDQLVARIALYPDALIAQILLAAAEPAKVKDFDTWLTANSKTLAGTKLQDAAVKAGFDASLVALALFPQVVKQMASDIPWTTQLGKTFAVSKDAVFNSIQKMRRQAQEVGTLKSTPQQEVKTETTSSGEQVIIIEPTNPQVVYVPQYNPQVVYTQAPTTTTVIIQEDDDDAAEAMAAGLIGFTAGIVIGASMDNHYYGGYGWYGGVHMYNDGWDNYLDHREDARDDWMDHREDVIEERGDYAKDRQENRNDRAQNGQEQRTERQENRTDNRASGESQRTQSGASAQTQRSQSGTSAQTQRAQSGASAQSSTRTPSASSTRSQGTQQRSGSSDAFSGYSSGKSQRSASSRGQSSRGSSRGGGGRRR